MPKHGRWEGRRRPSGGEGDRLGSNQIDRLLKEIDEDARKIKRAKTRIRENERRVDFALRTFVDAKVLAASRERSLTIERIDITAELRTLWQGLVPRKPVSMTAEFRGEHGVDAFLESLGTKTFFFAQRTNPGIAFEVSLDKRKERVLRVSTGYLPPSSAPCFRFHAEEIFCLAEFLCELPVKALTERVSLYVTTAVSGVSAELHGPVTEEHVTSTIDLVEDGADRMKLEKE